MARKHRGTEGMKRMALAGPVVLLSFVLLATGTLAGVARAPVVTDLGTTYGGRTYGLGVLTPLGDTYFADTGDLPSEGGALFADFTSVDTDVASALIWLSYVRGFGDVGVSEPVASGITLLPGDPLEVAASFAYARSSATCDGVSGWSEIPDLSVGGVSFVVTGDPNQVIYSVPGVFTLVANEQVDNSFGLTKSLTVNALHLWTTTVELIVSSATSTVTCGGVGLFSDGTTHAGTIGTRGGIVRTTNTDVGGLPRPMHIPPADFMTGGGHFLPPNSNRPGNVNFGFNAGPRPGNPTNVKGHLNLIDHYSGDHVQGTDVTDYFRFGDPQDNCRIFAGPAKFNGNSGYNFRVVACDYGEPGRDDRFAIEVRYGTTTEGSPIYFADDGRSFPPCSSNEPYCGELDGGNIQLHRF